MRKHAMKLPGLAVVAALLICGSAGSAGAHQGTAEQQQACTPYFFKFCSSLMGSSDEVIGACLKRNSAKMADGLCKQLFTGPAKK
jgi:hypothetical protein